MTRAMLQRDVELAALGRRLDDVRAGAGRVVVVEGAAGIGKSSLLSAVARDAAAGGFRVLRAWGGPLEREAGWGVARRLFAPVHAGPEWPELAVGAAALAGRALDPDAAERALAEDAGHAATHGLTWLATGLAERAPTLLVVDDVHHADAPSLRWLAVLGRQLADLPLGIVCAVRSGEPPAAPELLAELLAAAPEPPVVPRPLGPAAAGRLVAERLPTAGPGFAEACHAATAGNPFLLRALLEHVATQGIEPTTEAGATLGTFGPAQVARTIELQLSRLPAGATDLARAFAVLGQDAPLRPAAELAGLATARGPELADHLTAAGLLTGADGRYALVHPLVAGALEAGIPPAGRAGWHARAAALLRRDGADPETVALHLLRTEPARDATTVAVLQAAAARASAGGAPESAAVLLRRALAEPPPDPGVEADVRAGLGIALAAHTRPGAAELLAAAVGLATTPEQRTRIALAGGRVLGVAGLFEEAAGLCRLGLRHAAADDPALRSTLEAELLCNTWLHPSGAAEARTFVAAHDGDTTPSWQVHTAFAAMADARPVAVPRDLLAAAVVPGRPIAAPDSLIETLALLGLVTCDEVDAATRRCTELIDLAGPRGWRAAHAHSSFLRAMAHLRAGRIHDAAADARLAFDFKLGNSPPFAVQWGLIPLLEALVELDELDDAEAVLAAAARAGDPPPDTLTVPLVRERRAALLLARQRPAEAHAELVAAAATWKRLGIRHPGLAAWRVPAAEALAALDDVAGARAVASEHLSLAAAVGLPAPRGAGARALARVSDPPSAAELLHDVARELEGSPARAEYARVLVELGAALRRSNRRAEAREPLRRGLELADRGGMRRLAARARHELNAAGVRPRRAARSGVAALTPAEHRVATLAADGLGNPEIAQRLYVTRRTVETHLTHAFRKLGVATRTELAAAFDVG